MYRLRREGFNHRFWNSSKLFKAEFDFKKHFPLYAYGGNTPPLRIGKKGKIRFNRPHLYSDYISGLFQEWFMLHRFKWFKKSWGKYPFWGATRTGLKFHDKFLRSRIKVGRQDLFGRRSVNKFLVSRDRASRYRYGRY